MATAVREKLLTAEEFALIEDPPGMTSELIKGRVCFMTVPRTGHGRRGARIDRALAAFAEAHDLGTTTGEGGYLLRRDPDTVRAPDAAFLAKERIPAGGIPEDEYIHGAPTLAVEVVSPSDRPSRIAEKVEDWLATGCERVWVVRPRDRSVTVHRADGTTAERREDEMLDSLDAGFAATGFALRVSEIFG